MTDHAWQSFLPIESAASEWWRADGKDEKVTQLVPNEQEAASPSDTSVLWLHTGRTDPQG